MNQEKLLSPKSVAEMLGVSLQTIYRWSCEKKIPKIKIYGSLRFRPSDISNWLAQPPPVKKKAKPVEAKTSEL
jgi:excisionase family DNA binding protein